MLSTFLFAGACVGTPGGGTDGGASGDGGPPTADGAPASDDAGNGGGPDADVFDPLAPPPNPFGIGLVSPGDATQWDRTAELAGRGGHIKLIFPGVALGMTTAPDDWKTAVSESYARDLIPVIRIGPPWGDRNIRALSDDAGHMSYTSVAAAYAAVVASLPRRESWPLVIEVHNEANLCYEWECQPQNAPSHPEAQAGWIHYTDTAAEYAAFLRDVTTAIRAIGDSRIRIINGGLAPGGAVTCECGGGGFTAGATSRDFLVAMEAAVPGVHASLDGFASHSYPAMGEGWGFFESYDASGPGLAYYQTELSILGIDKPVYMTETGWTIGAGAHGSREDVAAWTLSAWTNDWFDNEQIAAVTPFILQDGSWNDFAWIDGAGAPYPVFTAIRDWRCSMSFPDPC